MRAIGLRLISVQDFEKYGWVIGRPFLSSDIETQFVRYWDRIPQLWKRFRDINPGLLLCKQKEIVCTHLEALINSYEAYICLDGEPSVLFVAHGTQKEPDKETIQAFLLPGGGVVIKSGVWHWSPFPLNRDSLYLLLTEGPCIQNEKGKVSVDPREVIVVQLSEAITIL